MASFAKAGDERLVAYYEGTMDYEEFALLWEQNVSKNPSFPCKDYEKFDLETMNPVECKAEFRFEKNDLPSLAEALQIPDTVTFVCQQRSVCDGMEGLCTALEILLSFAIQRHDFSLRQTCASAFHDNKHSGGFYIQYAWPPHHGMEQIFARPNKAGAVRRSGCREGGSIG